jgi:hypothetical protein
VERAPSRALLGQDGVRDSLAAGGAAVLSALLTAYAIAAVLAAVVSGATGAATSGFPLGRMGAWFFGLGFGAPLVLEAGGSASSFGSGSVGASLHVPIPLILAMACAVTVSLTVRFQRSRPIVEPVGVLVASGCAAVVPLVVGMIDALASQTSSGASALIFTGSAHAGLSVLAATLYPALIVFLVSAAARCAAGGVRVPAAFENLGVGPALRAVGDYLLFTAGLASVVVLVAMLLELPSVGAAFGIWLLMFPGLGLLGAQLTAFAPLHLGGSTAGSLTGSGPLFGGGGLPSGGGSLGGSTSFSLYGGALPAWAPLLLLIPMLGLVVAGLRYTLRRPPAVTAPCAGSAVTGLAMVVVTFGLDRYLEFGGSAAGSASTSALGGASGGGAGGIGIGALGYLSAFVVGALIPLVGWLLTPVLYRRAPGALRAAAAIPVRSSRVRAVLPPRRGEAPRTYAGPQTPPAAEIRRPTGGLVVVAIVLLAVAGGGGVGWVLAGNSHTTPSATGTLGGDAGQTVAPPSIGLPSFSDDPATETPTLPSEPPTSAAPPTVSAGGIALGEVADNPVSADIADTLDSYFGSINAHDGAGAASAFDPSGAINPNDPSQVAKFQRDTSTSTDDQIVVHSIQADPANPGGYLVAVSFRSQQAPSFGPGGNEACTLWTLTYQMTAQFKLLRSHDGQHTSC